MRKEALAQGLKRYHGRPCKNCGTTEKFTCNWGCVHCVTIQTKNRSPEIFRRYIKSDRGQKWIKEFRHSPTFRAVQNRWSIKSGFHREQQIRRRAQKLGSLVQLTDDEKQQIKDVYVQAARLTEETGIVHHVDHTTPLSENGLHHPDNLQILTDKAHWIKCAEENRKRNSKC